MTRKYITIKDSNVFKILNTYLPPIREVVRGCLKDKSVVSIRCNPQYRLSNACGCELAMGKSYSTNSWIVCY